MRHDATGHVTSALYRGALVGRYLGPRRSKAFGAGAQQIGRIYVINLDRHTKRWQLIQRELARLRDGVGAPLLNMAKRVAAIDARYPIKPAPSRVQSTYSLADQLHVDPRALPSSLGDPARIPVVMSQEEFAISLSHVKVWELIAAGDHSYSLILEDDVYFRRAFCAAFDRAWSTLRTEDNLGGVDLLFVSYEEALSGAEWQPASGLTRRPIRGLWQLSGYILSQRGARRLLAGLPVRGPVDLWINSMFDSLDVVALRRPMIQQRRDIPSSNFYSVLPVLSKVGLLTSDKTRSFETPDLVEPIFGVGEENSGVTDLAMALSMLGYRCCSGITRLPEAEEFGLFRLTDQRVFEAYVNVQSLDSTRLAQLAELYPKSKFIVTVGCASQDHRLRETRHVPIGSGQGFTAVDDLHAWASLVDALAGDHTRLLILPVGYSDKWQMLSEFLGTDYPSHEYPSRTQELARSMRVVTRDHPQRPRRCVRLEWDSLPWIARANDWRGIQLLPVRPGKADARWERFSDPDAPEWHIRDDTFPGNLALFARSNVEMVGDGAARLILRSERTTVRAFTSGALSTSAPRRYGRFAADLLPAKVPGLITGMFLHRNSPRQEVDIEFFGHDTSKMLTNVYYNPGPEGARLEYGYRGTPELIDLGFDAADGFHRYELDWTPERLVWLVDGVVVSVREHWDPTPIPHQPMQFHINLWATRSAALAGRLNPRRLPAYAHLRDVSIASLGSQ